MTAPTASTNAAGPTTAELEAQEARLQLTRFDNDDAWRLGCLLVDMCRTAGHPVAVDIRRGEQQLFHYALPGSSADNDVWNDTSKS